MNQALLLTLIALSLCGGNTPNFADPVKSEKLTFKVDTVLKGLNCPWGIDFLPNGDMLFTEREGQLRLVRKGKLDPKPIGGVPEVKAKSQGGLLDIALHPDYEKNGWIYISYSSPDEKGSADAHTALMRAKLKDHQLVEQQILFKGKPSVSTGHHYGSRIVFDGDYVFLSVGERGKMEMAQDLNNHMGKVIRLHHDGSIPKDNPFVNTSGAMPEIYSYGHRNPQGMVKHPTTGVIWETEHGPRGGDELNIVKAGANYGWPKISYGINYDGTILTKDSVKAGMEQPVIFWRPSIAPCGMTFVTSNKYKPWNGNLLVGSMSFTYLERLEMDGNKVTHQEKLLKGIGRIRVIKQGTDGFIYVGIEGPGMIIRLKPV